MDAEAAFTVRAFSGFDTYLLANLTSIVINLKILTFLQISLVNRYMILTFKLTDKKLQIALVIDLRLNLHLEILIGFIVF